MRRIALITLAAMLPSLGWAQVRVRIGEAGMGVSAAPAPMMTAPALQPLAASFAAPSLSPSVASASPLIAPALSVAVQPAAAARVAPAKIVTGAMSSLKPAAAAADKIGSEQALAAGSALFDGALAAPAIGDGPFVSGLAPESRRTSGLSPPADGELIGAYREANPKSKAVETFGRDFVSEAAQTIYKYTFMGSSFLEGMKSQARARYRAAADFVATHDAREHAPSRRFMGLLGRWYAFQDQGIGRESARSLPPSPIPGGEYWDMASGMNARSFIHHELDLATRYSFFDYSPFVASYLETAAELAGVKNAVVVEADLLKLARPAKPLAVLRTKNAAHYVPGFDKKLEVMADWIAPGGQLIIQNDPNPSQRAMIIEKHGPLVRRLIEEGWEFEYGFSGSPGNWGGYALDTITVTRPKVAFVKSAKEAAAEWASYERAVQYLERSFNPLDFLFR